MNLYRKILTPAFIDVKTSGVTQYHFANSNPDVLIYEDVTSLNSIVNEGVYAYRDFKFIREQARIAGKALAGNNWENWNSLTTEEKDCLSSKFMIPEIQYWSSTIYPHLMSQGFTTEDIQERVEAWDILSTQSRSIRYEHARSYIANNIVEAKQILHEIVTQYNYHSLYTGGIEGTLEDNLQGLLDFIDGRAGTDFELGGVNEGLRHRSLTSAKSSTVLADEIMTILKDGDFLLKEYLKL